MNENNCIIYIVSNCFACINMQYAAQLCNFIIILTAFRLERLIRAEQQQQVAVAVAELETTTAAISL